MEIFSSGLDYPCFFQVQFIIPVLSEAYVSKHWQIEKNSAEYKNCSVPVVD